MIPWCIRHQGLELTNIFSFTKLIHLSLHFYSIAIFLLFSVHFRFRQPHFSWLFFSGATISVCEGKHAHLFDCS
jgi:hypothetical protein